MRITKKEGVTKVKLEHNKVLLWIILALVIFLILIFIAMKNVNDDNLNKSLNNPNSQNNTKNAQIANPASSFCINHNGTLDIRNDSNGNQYGVCKFNNGTECEEWAYFRGTCSI